jgi:hypothetical protein
MNKYQISIENFEFSSKDKSKSIMDTIKYYQGEIDDATSETIYFGFPSELKQLCANGSLSKLNVYSDLWIDGVKK